jgi:glucuronokinase
MQTTPAVESLDNGAFRSRVYARIGLLGNPSDGYNGAVLAFSLKNFYAEVTITPSIDDKITFELSQEGDPNQFTDLESFEEHIDGHGYNGGVRLLMAMTREFGKYCSGHRIPLDPSLKFSLSYSTNIPRQRGLSGSSAIACAALNCLLAFYNISEEKFRIGDRPAVILSAEKALGITAGMQDRIIQVYGGLVSMDFTDNAVYPLCKSLDPGVLLPPLYLIFNLTKGPGKDSGSVHSQFKEKWLVRDVELQRKMRETAALVPQGLAALENKDFSKLASLMARNFQLRKSMFGEAALGEESLKLIEIADSVSVAAKFTGSGGAVVVLPLNEEQKIKLEQACRRAGVVCLPVEVGPVHHFI